MRSLWKRLSLAAFLSLAGVGGTVFWYDQTAPKMNASGEAPLAQAAHVDDEVLRRPPTRLLWRAVNNGDDLFNGETIRTSDQGEMRIQFQDGRYVDLEPDSLIVLQKSNGEINLDLLDGSLFVNAKAGGRAATTGLVLNSANGKVDLSNASATLSKGNGDGINLHVLEGQAKIRDKSGKENSVDSGHSSAITSSGVQVTPKTIHVISPVIDKPYYVDPDGNSSVVFKWQGVGATEKVTLLTGPSRKSLHENAAGAAGVTQLSANLPIGKSWWKLVAKDANGAVLRETQLERIVVMGRYPPTLVNPEDDEIVKIEKSPSDIKVHWQAPDDVLKVRLEVFRSTDPKHPVYDKEFLNGDSTTVPGMQPGDYLARVSASYLESTAPVSSRLRRFSVRDKVKETVQIVWEVPEAKLKQTYLQKPELEMSWQAKNRLTDIADYEVRLVPESGPNNTPIFVSSKKPSVKAAVLTAGRYIASVDARDKNGRVIGSSEPLALTALEAPLPPPPVFEPPDGNLQSGYDGRTVLKWTPVSGAKEYVLHVVSKSGKDLLNRKYPQTEARLKNLMPGEYKVSIETVDGHGRTGPTGQARKLMVPDKSNVRSPKLKKVLVE